MRSYKRWLVTAVIGATALILVWWAVGIMAVQSQTPRGLWLARSYLVGIYRLGSLMENPWFVAFSILVVVFGSQVSRFLSQVTTVEVQGVKLLAPSLPATISLVAVVSWKEGYGGPPESDVPGGDGVMAEEPDRLASDYDRYQQCMTEMPSLFNTLNMANQDDVGLKLKALEGNWRGDYAQHLEKSVQLVRRCVERKQVNLLTNKYLATSVILRHIMLYMYGKEQHFDQLLEDLAHVRQDYAMGTLCEPYNMRFLMTLCDRNHIEKAKHFANIALMRAPACWFSREAYLAYIELKTGAYAEAYGRSAAALMEPPRVDWATEKSPSWSAVFMLKYVAARAALHAERHLDAVRYARETLSTHIPKAPVYRETLHREARRILAQGCLALDWRGELYRLYTNDSQAHQDPYVVNALAVLLQGRGRSDEAKALTKQAQALLSTEDKDSELSNAIRRNSQLLHI